MEYSYTLAIVFVLAFIGNCYHIYRYRRDNRWAKGPLPWPLVGNIWTVYRLHTDTERVLERLAKQYGDICMLWIGVWPAIVINSAEAAHDILHKRGAVTASRPAHSDFRVKVGRGRLVLTPAGPDLTKLRKIYSRLLNSTKKERTREVLESESILFLDELLRTPESFYESCERYALSIIFTSTYGARLKSMHNEVVSGLFRVWDVLLSYFQPGTVLLPDTFPALLKLPKWLQPWDMLANHLIRKELSVHQTFIDRLKGLQNSGLAPDCFCTTLLKVKEAENIDDAQMRGILAMIIGAGSDTTGSVLQMLFKVMALHPETLTMVQQELDAIVGRDRLPTWEDEKDLPYTRALIKELHRWAPIGLIGIPHAATDSFEYKGRLVPNGTILFPNLISLTRDPARYEDPNAFNPLRFIDDPNDAYACAVHSDWKKRDHFHYGFGRRICLGVNMGEASLFIAVSRILWGFDIKARMDSRLNMFDKVYGLATKPKPFKVDITVRDEKAAQIIRNETPKASINVSGVVDM